MATKHNEPSMANEIEARRLPALPRNCPHDLGSLVSVAKFGHFELSGQSESLIRRTRAFRKKTRDLCSSSDSLKRERQPQTRATIPRVPQNSLKVSRILGLS